MKPKTTAMGVALLAALLLVVALALPATAHAQGALTVGQLTFTPTSGVVASTAGAGATGVSFDQQTGVVTVVNPAEGDAADIVVTPSEAGAVPGAREAPAPGGGTVTNLDLSAYSGRITLSGVTLSGNGTHPAVQLTNQAIAGCTLVVQNGAHIHGGKNFAIRGAYTKAPTGYWGSTIELHNVADRAITSASGASTVKAGVAATNAGELHGAVINPGTVGAITFKSYGDNTISSDQVSSGYDNWPIISPYKDVDETIGITLNFTGEGSLTLIGENCNGIIHLGPQAPSDKGIATINVFGPGTLTTKSSSFRKAAAAGIIVDGCNPKSALNVYGGTFYAIGNGGDGSPSDGIYVNSNGSANFYGGTTVAIGAASGSKAWGANGVHAGRITLGKSVPHHLPEGFEVADKSGPVLVASGGSIGGKDVSALGVTQNLGNGENVAVNPQITTGSSDDGTFYPWLVQSFSHASGPAIPSNFAAETALQAKGNVLEAFAGDASSGSAIVTPSLSGRRWVKISPQPLTGLTVHAEPQAAMPGDTFGLTVTPLFEGIAADTFTTANATVLGSFLVEPASVVTPGQDGAYTVSTTATSGTLRASFAVDHTLKALYADLPFASAAIKVDAGNDKQQLKEAIASACQTPGTKNDGRYTNESWKAYAAALQQAQALVDDPSASAGQVASAEAALREAIGGLVFVSEGPHNPGNPNDPKPEYTPEPADKVTEAVTTDDAVSSINDAIAAASDTGETPIAKVAKPEVTKDQTTGIDTVTWTVDLKDPETPASAVSSVVLGSIVKAAKGARAASAESLDDPGLDKLNLTTATDAKIVAFTAQCLEAALAKAQAKTLAVAEGGTAADVMGNVCQIKVNGKNVGSNAHDYTIYKVSFVGDRSNPHPEPPAGTDPKPEAETVTVYRVRNPYTNEHLFTADASEVKELVSQQGWEDEGIGWTAPAKGIKVIRLFNPYNDDHYYTMNEPEAAHLERLGWRLDESQFMSLPEGEGVAVTSLFNPYVTSGTHLFTASTNEIDKNVALGWKDHSVAFWVVEAAAR